VLGQQLHPLLQIIIPKVCHIVGGVISPISARLIV